MRKEYEVNFYYKKKEYKVIVDVKIRLVDLDSIEFGFNDREVIFKETFIDGVLSVASKEIKLEVFNMLRRLIYEDQYLEAEYFRNEME